MAGKDAWRNVRFGQPKEDAVRKKEFWRRMKEFFCKDKGKRAAVAFLDSLPNGLRAEAREAVRMAHGKQIPPLVKVKEAVVCDGGNGDEDTQRRRDLLFAICFGRRNPHINKEGLLGSHESVNVLFFRIDLFLRMMKALMKKGEEEELRSKGEDRLEVLRALEWILNAIPPKDKIEAFERIVEITEKMAETLCTKEVCARLVKYMANLEGTEGSMLVALNEMHERIIKVGVEPYGKDKYGSIPPFELMKAKAWLASRSAGVIEAAWAVWAAKKPHSYEECMKRLEEDENDLENKKLYVLEKVVGKFRNYEPADKNEMRTIAWNIGYFCIDDISYVASLANGMENEEEMRLEALDTILWVARKMPPGKRMEAPAMIAKAVRYLLEPEYYEMMCCEPKPKEWIITTWMNELRRYMSEPREEVAFSKLSWLTIHPMKIILSA